MIVEDVFWADHIWYGAVLAQAEAARLPQQAASMDLSKFCDYVDFCEWEVGT